MFDFSWSEMMLIGAIALVVIGPKDLPKALKTAGIVVRKARGLAREFHNSVDEMIRESELDDVRKSVHEATTLDLNRIQPKPAVMTGPPVSHPPVPAVSTEPPLTDKPDSSVAADLYPVHDGTDRPAP